MSRVAPLHGAGGSGAPVRDPGAEAPQKNVPELTLDRTVRLLESAWDEPELRLARAVELVEYHIRRNKIAKASHDRRGSGNTRRSNSCCWRITKWPSLEQSDYPRCWAPRAPRQGQRTLKC